MSQETQTKVQTTRPPQVPLIVQYHQQLATFKQQRDVAKTNLDQLNGAVFACEHMIKQYDESVKITLIDPALKASNTDNSLMPNENLGAIDNGQVNDETEKQVA